MKLNPDGYSVAGCNIIYAPRGQAGEYAKLATNPYKGCGHACSYCLDGDTLIQLADGTTKPIRDIAVGEAILGIAINGKARAWNTRIVATTVLAKVASCKAAYRIALADGTTVICSADHRWLTDRGWKYTQGAMCGPDQRPYLTTNNAIRKVGGATLTPAVNDSVRVVGIEPLNEVREMFDIMTGTENFIANGMVSHNCYVPRVLRMPRPEFDAGAEPRPDFLAKLRNEATKYQALGVTEQVMLSFTTDPYHPSDTTLTREVLLALQEHGLGICTLTKGGSRALRDIDLFRPERDAFATTLTSLEAEFSRKWERNAALPGDRIATLKAFHDAGIFTWVSLEPTLDTDSSLEIVRETYTFVDLYKVGRANYLPMTNVTNWLDYTIDMINLLISLGKKHYIKKDLQPYLPKGYYNPQYIDQFHPAKNETKPFFRH